MGFEPTLLSLKESELTVFLLQIFAVCALWSQQRITISQPFDYKSNALPLCYAGRLEKGKEFGEQFQSHASSMELHNLEYT